MYSSRGCSLGNREGETGNIKDTDEEEETSDANYDDSDEYATSEVVSDLENDVLEEQGDAEDSTVDNEWGVITDLIPDLEECTFNESTFNIPIEDISPAGIFSLFVTHEVINKMVTGTNKYALKVIAKKHHNNDIKKNSRLLAWKPTNCLEMRHFLGLLLAMGLNKVPHINNYWSKQSMYRNEYIASVMKRDKFLLLLKFWHFCDVSSIIHNDNKLKNIFELANMLNNNFQRILTPGKYIVIGESMIPPNKFHRYGIKIYKLCTPEGYTYNTIVYSGKGDNGPQKSHSKLIVLKLIQGLENQSRVVIADNFYSSIELAEKLLSQKTRYCGTLNPNVKGLPESIVSLKLSYGEIKGAMNKNGVKVIKWVDKLQVLMLSTLKEDKDVLVNTGKKNRKTNQDIQNPTCVSTYINSKKEIEFSGQLTSHYNPIKKSLTWIRKVAMEYLFGMALLNAWIIYKTKNEKQVSKQQFTEAIIESLTRKNIICTDKIPVLPEDPEHTFEMSEKRRNCAGCYDKLRKTYNSAEVKKKVKKIKTYCRECKQNLCAMCFEDRHKSHSTGNSQIADADVVESSHPSDLLGTEREAGSGHPTTSSVPEWCLQPSISGLIDVKDVIDKQVLPIQSRETLEVLPLNNAPLAMDFSDEDNDNGQDPYDEFALSLAKKIRSLRDVNKRIRLMNALQSMADKFLVENCITNTWTKVDDADDQRPVYVATSTGMLMMSPETNIKRKIMLRPPSQKMTHPAPPEMANKPVQTEIQPNLTQQSIPPLHYIGSKSSSNQIQENKNLIPPVIRKNTIEAESGTDGYVVVEVPVKKAKTSEFAVNKTPKTYAQCGRVFRARKSLLNQQDKQQQEPDAIDPGPSEIRRKAKAADATRRLKENKKGVIEAPKKQANTAACTLNNTEDVSATDSLEELPVEMANEATELVSFTKVDPESLGSDDETRPLFELLEIKQETFQESVDSTSTSIALPTASAPPTTISTGNESQASIKESLMDQNNELDDELQREMKLNNACLKRHSKKALDEERMKQKGESAIDDTQTAGPSHCLIKNVPFVYDPIPIKTEVVEDTDKS